MPTLEFELRQQSRIQNRAVRIDQVVIAGWTGRDHRLVQRHIDELKAMGIPEPSATPLFYRVSADLVTQSSSIQVLGPASSGEIEPVLFAAEDGIWLTIGSDHTDRDVERAGVALAKQLCPKPVARTAWRWDEIHQQAENMLLKSWIGGGEDKQAYQQGTLAEIMPLNALLQQMQIQLGFGLEPGTMLFCGTLATEGGLRTADQFSGLLLDPSAGRTITLDYEIDFLRIVS
ncbi:MAG: DUF2848 domain-containing protein [Burkholderiaceae bacterium]